MSGPSHDFSPSPFLSNPYPSLTSSQISYAPRCPHCFLSLQGPLSHPLLDCSTPSIIQEWLKCHVLQESLLTPPTELPPSPREAEHSTDASPHLPALTCSWMPILSTMPKNKTGTQSLRNEWMKSFYLLATDIRCGVLKSRKKVASAKKYLPRNLRYAELTDKKYRDVNLGLRNLHTHKSEALFWHQYMSNNTLLPRDSEEMDSCIGWW